MYKNVTWLVETGLDEEGGNRLLESLRALGCHVVEHSGSPVGFGHEIHLDSNQPIVFHGCLQGASWVQAKRPWIPGAIANRKQLDCRYYYPRLHEHILNHDHVFLPWGCLNAQKEMLLHALGEDGCIFVRPDSNWKEFSGQIVCRDTWDRDLEIIGWYGLDPEMMVVVARPEVVVDEWRFFVSGNRVLTGSQYRKDRKTVRILADAEITEVAQGFLNHANKVGYSPDPVWVLDVCRTGGGQFCILEVGSFSCAGLYACDTDILAKAVTEIAVREWEDVQ